MKQYRVVVAADQAGVAYKDAIARALAEDPRVSEVIDVGVAADSDETAYPLVGHEGASVIAEGRADRGVFVCGTGMGMAIAANKVPGVRASTAHDSYSVERLVRSNNAQVLCLGQRVIGPELALRLAKEFLNYEFDPNSASARKVAIIAEQERARSM